MARNIRALTGVRGVAAVMIMVYHFDNIQLFDGGHVTHFVIPHGYMLVDLFFMLSGYVIALIYRDTLYQKGGLATFMLKRVARLYPAYLTVGILYAAKIAAGLSGQDTLGMFLPYDIAGNLLMMTGWGFQIRPLIGASWAASAEVASYLLLPLLMTFTIRRSALLAGLTVVAAVLAIVAVTASGRGTNGPLDVTAGDSFYPMLRVVAGFTLGLAIFRFAGVVDRLSPGAQDLALCVVLGAMVAAAVGVASDLPLYLLYMPLLALLSRDGRLAQLLFGNDMIYRVGIKSYSIYLIHPPFVSFAVRWWRDSGESETAYIAATAVCFVAILALSELSYRWVETPGRKAIVDWVSPKSRRTVQNALSDNRADQVGAALDFRSRWSTGRSC
jgi:peptidoglycan/LPS O-acetylase OafA/YrhL